MPRKRPFRYSGVRRRRAACVRGTDCGRHVRGGGKVLRQAEFLVRPDHVDEMMRDGGALVRRGLRRADVHAAVQGHRVHGDDFAADLPRQLDSHGRFARGRRAGEKPAVTRKVEGFAHPWTLANCRSKVPLSLRERVGVRGRRRRFGGSVRTRVKTPLTRPSPGGRGGPLSRAAWQTARVLSYPFAVVICPRHGEIGIKQQLVGIGGVTIGQGDDGEVCPLARRQVARLAGAIQGRGRPAGPQL